MSKPMLLVLLLIAAVMDMMTLRVRNLLILVGLILGFGLSIMTRGPSGIVFSFLGMVVPLAVFSIFYYFHMIGAGDIKLLAVTGVFLGPAELIRCLFPILLAGGILSLIKVLYERNLTDRLIYLADYFNTYNKTKQVTPYYRGEIDKSGVIPFSVAILIGVFLHMEGWI